jgi:hypothetical protein
MTDELFVSRIKALTGRTLNIIENMTEEDYKTIMNKQKTCLDLSLAILEWALEQASNDK